jgi:hypothetical protein
LWAANTRAAIRAAEDWPPAGLRVVGYGSPYQCVNGPRRCPMTNTTISPLVYSLWRRSVAMLVDVQRGLLAPAKEEVAHARPENHGEAKPDVVRHENKHQHV